VETVYAAVAVSYKTKLFHSIVNRMAGVTFEVEDDGNDQANVLYEELVLILTHPALISVIFVTALFFYLRKPWPKFRDFKGIRGIVTDIIANEFQGISLGVPSETRTHIHIPIVVNVEEQFFVVTQLVERVQPYGCEVLAMSTTDYPNRRNFVLRIPLSGHMCTLPLTLQREIAALALCISILSIVHYAREVLVFK